MFTYLDPQVRTRLVAGGHLVRIDPSGRRIDIEPGSERRPERSLDLLGPVPLPVRIADRARCLEWYAAVRSAELDQVDELAELLRRGGRQRLFATLSSSMAVNSVLLCGNPRAAAAPLVRVHSCCLTGDVFGSRRCECGPQLSAALARIAREPEGGAVVYMAGHEGRGIGLWAKAATYVLQDSGENTYQANRSLGLPDDSRDFSDAATLLLHFFGDRPIRLLTNNPKKVEDLRALGLRRLSPVKLVAGVNDWNRRYLAAKREWGHWIDDDDLARNPGGEGAA